MNERIWQLAYLAAIAAVSWLFGWHGWMTLVAIVIAVAAVFTLSLVFALARGIVRDTWPRGVPPELTGKYMALKAEGWRLPRVHRWWKCGEARLHTHLFMPGAPAEGRELIMIWGGTTVLDERGNIVWREP